MPPNVFWLVVLRVFFFSLIHLYYLSHAIYPKWVCWKFTALPVIKSQSGRSWIRWDRTRSRITHMHTDRWKWVEAVSWLLVMYINDTTQLFLLFITHLIEIICVSDGYSLKKCEKLRRYCFEISHVKQSDHRVIAPCVLEIGVASVISVPDREKTTNKMPTT